MTFQGWLLLLYALPTGRNSLRVNLWRKLKKAGAVSLKTSASLLPDTSAHYELFQWFAKQIEDGGGEATLIRAKEIENISEANLVTMFNDARGEDYAALIRELTPLLRAKRRTEGEQSVAVVERLRGRFEDIRKIDFFGSPRAHDAEMLFRKAEGLHQTKARPSVLLNRADYQGKTWLTRPRPQIDRVGSAWLIKTFIDPKAKYAFGAKPSEHPSAIPYDMADVELTHQGDDCTFETLLKRFGLRDKPLEKIAAMVHDADLHDDKFHAPGAEGIDRVLDGLARMEWTDEKILQQGFILFEALYAQVKAT